MVLFVKKLDTASIGQLNDLKYIDYEGKKFFKNQQIAINVSKALQITTDHFLSITIDSGIIQRHWQGFDFR